MLFLVTAMVGFASYPKTAAFDLHWTFVSWPFLLDLVYNKAVNMFQNLNIYLLFGSVPVAYATIDFPSIFR